MNKKEIKKGRHPEKSLFRISSLLKNDRKVGGPEQKHLRTTHCAAFTLIELLVVVLIIGILAAVALPQYQKAITKTRLGNLKVLVNSVAQVAEEYYLANNEYPTAFDDIAVSLPEPLPGSSANRYNYSWGSCILENSSEGNIMCINNLSKIGYIQRFSYISSVGNRRKKACYAANSVAIAVCKSDTGSTSAFYSADGWDAFWY